MKRFAIALFFGAVMAMVASVAWFVRGVKAEVWKSNQHMHIRWNVTWLSDQYDRIERIGDANLRNDYITNFLHNACTLLNLEFTRWPNTSNLVERYYFDWDDRIDEAESADRNVSSPSQSVELKNSSAFTLEAMPELLTAKVPPKVPVRFSLEENPTTGYQWEIEYNKSECEVKTEWREPRRDLMGAPGQRVVEVTSLVQTPVRVEFRYARPFEKGKPPAKSMRLIVYTAEGEMASPLYPKDATFELLKKECERRGIVITDWHLHIRGGMTPEMAAKRELDSGIRSTAMENHGREWEIFDNKRLAEFADKARKVDVGGHTLPVGIQVNDRDWFRQIDEATRAKFDYILADTMIMGKLPDGRDNRLWLVKEIPDANAWMEEYMKHNLQILDEPIDILANPTYLPLPLADEYDRLWTRDRMEKLIAKAIEKSIAIEIQAESPYPRPKFLKLAKEMGAKFSFGTNNFDPRPKSLSRWLEVIVWLNLKGDDIWQPK